MAFAARAVTALDHGTMQRVRVITLTAAHESPSRRRVGFTEETIDNENSDKRKSKCCCIFQKPRRFDESSSSSSDESEHDSHDERDLDPSLRALSDDAHEPDSAVPNAGGATANVTTVAQQRRGRRAKRKTHSTALANPPACEHCALLADLARRRRAATATTGTEEQK